MIALATIARPYVYLAIDGSQVVLARSLVERRLRVLLPGREVRLTPDEARQVHAALGRYLADEENAR